MSPAAAEAWEGLLKAAQEAYQVIPSNRLARAIAADVPHAKALRTESFSAADDAYAAEQEREILARREVVS